MKTNELIRREIEQYPEGYYIDIFDAMVDSNAQPRLELFLPDGFHLSLDGYALWTQSPATGGV